MKRLRATLGRSASLYVPRARRTRRRWRGRRLKRLRVTLGRSASLDAPRAQRTRRHSSGKRRLGQRLGYRLSRNAEGDARRGRRTRKRWNVKPRARMHHSQCAIAGIPRAQISTNRRGVRRAPRQGNIFKKFDSELFKRSTPPRRCRGKTGREI